MEGAAVVDGDGVAPLRFAGAGVAEGVLGCDFGGEGEEGKGEEGSEEGEAHGWLLVAALYGWGGFWEGKRRS